MRIANNFWDGTYAHYVMQGNEESGNLASRGACMLNAREVWQHAVQCRFLCCQIERGT